MADRDLSSLRASDPLVTPALADLVELEQGGNTLVGTRGEILQREAGEPVGWSDLMFERDAANIVGLRNGTNVQEARIYETFTDTANYARLSLITTAGDYTITPEAAGTGTLRDLVLGASGVDVKIPSGGHLVLPQVNEAATPTLQIGNMGWYSNTSGQLTLSAGGSENWAFRGSDAGFVGQANAAVLLKETASATNPVFVFEDDFDTGLGRAAADQFSLIAGGVQVANLTEAAGVVQMILPLQNDAGAPSLAFGSGNSGFFHASANTLSLSLGASTRFEFQTNIIFGIDANAGGLLNEAGSATNPTLVPSRSDLDTGVGWVSADIGALIAGGVNVMQFGESAAAPLMGFFGTAAVAQPTGVAVSAAGVHAAGVTLGLWTA